MQMVKIQIPDKTESAKASVEMARRGRIVCLPDDIYVVPEPALALLQSLGITFRELERGGLDYADKVLRDSTATHV
jgi:hypothetical protein